MWFAAAVEVPGASHLIRLCCSAMHRNAAWESLETEERARVIAGAYKVLCNQQCGVRIARGPCQQYSDLRLMSR